MARYTPKDTHLESAQQAALRYATEGSPGIVRRKAGAGFSYVDAQGQAVRDGKVLARIRALVIPPAWTDVWINPAEDGHIQATGRDVRGRKQYRYHPRWTEVRDEVKYGRMMKFGKVLPTIRRRAAADMKKAPLSRARVLATVVRLLEKTLIRVGNEEYAKTNGSYGLTTMQDRHVKVSGATLTFQFKAKSGVIQNIVATDAALARSVKKCQDLPGQTLFQYLDGAGQRQVIDSGDVNAYLREITGEEFTAKDFRTWTGTVLAAITLSEAEKVDSDAGRKKAIVNAIDHVAKQLGNTRAVCRRCYIHPAVVDSYLDGATIEMLSEKAEGMMGEAGAKLTPGETAVLALLRRRLMLQSRFNRHKRQKSKAA